MIHLYSLIFYNKQYTHFNVIIPTSPFKALKTGFILKFHWPLLIFLLFTFKQVGKQHPHPLFVISVKHSKVFLHIYLLIIKANKNIDRK